MTNSYARAYTEVLEILNHLPNEEYTKIPTQKIEFYRKNMDKNYNYLLDTKKQLAVNNISKEANSILVSIFRDYFATESQKQTLKKLLWQNQEKLEARREKYDINFKETIPEKNDIEDTYKETQLIEYKEPIFTKLTNFIKKLLGGKK